MRKMKKLAAFLLAAVMMLSLVACGSSDDGDGSGDGSGDGAKLECDEIIKDFVAEPYPLVNYTEEQMDEISKLTVDIYKYVTESWANWIVNGGIGNDWDGYIAQLNQMGLERLMEIYQEALDSYNSAS